MRSWRVTTTVTYIVNADTAEDAEAFVDDELEGIALSWAKPVAVEEK